MSETPASDSGRKNFITDIIDADLEAGRHDQIVTRFPPEPNGYLHIGHAKSICLNFGLAQDYQGQCHLRFDDTNPLKEDTEYVEAIKRDVHWLGFDWGEHLYFASDYFERLYEIAVHLIDKGLAYVDSSTLEEIREARGTLREPGRPTAYRDRSVEESRDLFARMRAGEFEDGAHILRAKIDLESPNMLMRDPVLYRIRHAHHHRTGDAWCIYPMYDYAHPLSDAIESITHSICTLEFENNREFYDWVVEAAADLLPARPHQYEFARLNLGYTMMSKRKLLLLVQEGLVAGWDDPRMPTIAGLRRRGYTPEAIRSFADMIGVAKANSLVDFEKLEYCIRDDLNFRAPRVMAVLDPLEVRITNWPEGEVALKDAPYYPEDVGKPGSREVPLSGRIYIDRSDFEEDPPKGFYRLSPGEEVRLRYGLVIKCEAVHKDDEGNVTSLDCTYDPEGGAGRRIRGVIHWVSAEHALPCEVRLYDRLFRAERPGASARDFREELNPRSLVVKRGFVEPSVADDDPQTRYQFTRLGYFWRDADSTEDALIFNRVVALRDSWSKNEDLPPLEPAEPAGDEEDEGRTRPQKKTRAEIRVALRADDPALAARFVRYQEELGLSQEDADVLTGESSVGDFFEAALAEYDNVESVTRWIVNELLRELKDAPIEEISITPLHLAHLARMVDADTISATAGSTVFAEMVAGSGEDPEAIVERLGLEQVSDAGELQAMVDELLDAHPDKVERYREGKRGLLGFFMGQLMRASGGAADPALAEKLLGEALEG